MRLECINLLIKNKFQKHLSLDTKRMFILALVPPKSKTTFGKGGFLELKELNIEKNLRNVGI